jgi:hypothetical protein
MAESQGYLEDIERERKSRKSFREERLTIGRRSTMSRVVARMTKKQMADLLVIISGYHHLGGDPVDIGWEMLFEQNQAEQDRLLQESMDESTCPSVSLQPETALAWISRVNDRYKRISALEREFDKMMDERYPRGSSKRIIALEREFDKMMDPRGSSC